jgi:hypothetical protein
MTHPSVRVQIAPESVPTTPSWFGEVAVLAHVCTQFGLLDAIQQRVRFARTRFGHDDTIDFLVVLIGYAVSGEPTGVNPFYRFMHTFDDAKPVAEADQNWLAHTCFASEILSD